MTDPWSVLGISPDASDEDLQRAYRRLAARNHPDVAGGDSRRMAEINAAYDQARRARSLPDAAADLAATPDTGHHVTPRPMGCLAVAAVVFLIGMVTVTGAITFAGRDAGDQTRAPTATSPTSGPKKPPWAEPRLPVAAAPLPASVWRRAPNRASCPLVVPAGAEHGRTARVLGVADGWGFAWGEPGGAARFGVTGRQPSGHRGRPPAEATLGWSDGSEAIVYRDGDRLVADLTIAGFDCRYGVFTTQGFADLASLLGALRFVDV